MRMDVILIGRMAVMRNRNVADRPQKKLTSILRAKPINMTSSSKSNKSKKTTLAKTVAKPAQLEVSWTEKNVVKTICSDVKADKWKELYSVPSSSVTPTEKLKKKFVNLFTNFIGWNKLEMREVESDVMRKVKNVILQIFYNQ